MLLNSEELITKLENSYFMRRAAQICAYMIVKGKAVGQKSLENLENSKAGQQFDNVVRGSGSRLTSFYRRFSEEIKKEMKKR